MKNLDQWCKSNQPQRRQSKLDNFQEAILKLYAEGYQIEQIQEFLRSQKIDVSVRYIRKYLKNKKTIQTKPTQGAQIADEPIIRSSVTQSFIDKYK